VRRHDVIFLPPGVEHAISNTGLVDLVFLVVTSPTVDGAADADQAAIPA
jgi:mannose-6-phosphate isomerase-like protein (cupin superfamily)